MFGWRAWFEQHDGEAHEGEEDRECQGQGIAKHMRIFLSMPLSRGFVPKRSEALAARASSSQFPHTENHDWKAIERNAPAHQREHHPITEQAISGERSDQDRDQSKFDDAKYDAIQQVVPMDDVAHGNDVGPRLSASGRDRW
jgi:hypothetical protein